MNLLETLIPTYSQMLGSLAGWLRKAAAQRPGSEADALMAARLAPDMFPLATQVRFACRQALEGLYRLHDNAFDAAIDTLLEEGRACGEQPGTIEQAQLRITETLAILDQDDLAAISIEPDSPLPHTLPTGMTFEFTAARYVRDWALPQFYFHLMTAYSILRSQGIELGKIDYVSHLLGLVRPHQEE